MYESGQAVWEGEAGRTGGVKALWFSCCGYP